MKRKVKYILNNLIIWRRIFPSITSNVLYEATPPLSLGCHDFPLTSGDLAENEYIIIVARQDYLIKISMDILWLPYSKY